MKAALVIAIATIATLFGVGWANAEAITSGSSIGHSETDGLIGSPPPATLEWDYATANDVLPRIGLTVHNIMPLWTWDGTTYLNPDNAGPGWVSEQGNGNALATLTITQANAATYGLDWLAFQAAIENPLYDRYHISFAGFDQLRIVPKLKTTPPGRPGYDVLWQDVTLSQIAIQLEYNSYAPAQTIQHFGKSYLSDGLFGVQAVWSGTGKVVVINYTPEPSTAALLVIGCVVALVVRRR
jgi:hypothetical protein